MAELPGNSISTLTQPETKTTPPENTTHRDKVTVGAAMVIKPEDKRPGFFAASAKEVGNFLWSEVLKPGLKNLMYEMVVNGTSGFLFDDSRSAPPRQGQRFSRIGYNSIYDETRLVSPEERRSRQGSSLVSRPNSVAMGDYIWFRFKEDAKKTISNANDIIDQYNWISVVELFELADLTCDWTLQDYGWDTPFQIQEPKPYTLDPPDERRGFIIRLPKAHKK